MSETVTYRDLVRAGNQGGGRLTYRQIDHWCRIGLLLPLNPGLGPGSRRLFPASELPIAAAMARLTAAGIPPEVARDIARHGKRELGPGIRITIRRPSAA